MDKELTALAAALHEASEKCDILCLDINSQRAFLQSKEEELTRAFEVRARLATQMRHLLAGGPAADNSVESLSGDSPNAEDALDPRTA